MKSLKCYLGEDYRIFDNKQFNHQWFIDKMLSEASQSEKRRKVKFGTSWFVNGQKNLGNIGSFGIVSPENPNSEQCSNKENNEYLKEFKKLLKNGKFTYVPIDGHFGGNKEHSFLIFNISQTELEYLASRFEQTSYIYCFPESDKEVTSEYYEKKTNGKNWDATENPYVFVNSSNIYHDEKNADDNFSIIGNKYKFTIDPEIFNKVSQDLEESINKVMQITGDEYYEVLEWTINRVGQKSAYIKKLLTENLVK